MTQVTAAGGPEEAPRGARARLLAAAVEAFAAKGFHGTTTRDIAAAAGMSPAALYVHHRSKEELLYLISRTGHDRTLSLIREAAAGAERPREQLVAVVRAFTAHHARSHTSARVVNYELAALAPDHLAEITAIRREINQVVRDLVEAGVCSGEFRTADPRMTALAVLRLGIDVARWYRDDGGWSPDQLADHYAEAALRLVGANAAETPPP
jgi:AcrR family transcriptional regulator